MIFSHNSHPKALEGGNDSHPGPFHQLKGPRVLVTGVTSIHGWPIWQSLSKEMEAERLLGIRSPKMEIPSGDNILPLCLTDRARLMSIGEAFQPTHLIHCGGVCDLDACEQHPTLAHSINVLGTRCLVEVFTSVDYFLYLSTDLVYSGDDPPEGGYAENHLPDPISVAGRTFALAEKEVETLPCRCIVRLGLPLGDSLTGDKGAVDFINSRFRRNLPLTLFYDELRSCIDCRTIPKIILRLLGEQIPGLFHLGGDRSWSLHEIGQYVLCRGDYSPDLLHRQSRKQEKDGPPRIGNVTLNSSKIKNLMGLRYLS